MIRRAQAADVSAIADLERRVFGSRAWSFRLVAEELAHPAAVVLLDETHDGLAGYVGLRIAADSAEVSTLAVHPDLRRAGIATALLAAGEILVRARGAEHLHLEVAEGNEAARALYRGRGYREVGRRHGYYDRSEDALLMTLDLGATNG
ncbi:MAG: ribosomal protein S18-alanine N-acetyltransferase [Deltaproteobacteria bacterium]|nr:ribosomal protein S18-alanine N-acetyltransferase [Deltaproteobacteria bacterium]